MNNLFGETVLIRIKQSTGWQRLFYGILFVASIFFTGATIYTILATIRLVATINPLPNTIFIYTAVYTLIAGTLAYSLYTARLWVTYMLLMHTLLMVLAALIILPLINLDAYTNSTLLGALPIAILGSLTFLKRSWLYPSNILIPTLLYTLLICFSLALSVMMYTKLPA